MREGGLLGSEVVGSLFFSLFRSFFLPCQVIIILENFVKKRLIKNLDTIPLETGNRHRRNRLSENKILSQCLRGGGAGPASRPLPLKGVRLDELWI